MSDEAKNKSLSPINNLLSQQSPSKRPLYQQVLTQLVNFRNLQKILKKVHKSVRDLEFITFDQFLQENGLKELSDDYFDKNDHFERYETELERRKRQLEILLQMEQIHFQKPQTKLSAQKSSRTKISAPQLNKYQQSSSRVRKNNQKYRKDIKLTSESHKYELHHENIKKTASRRKNSAVSARYSRQQSCSLVQSHKRIKQIEIYQTYTEGRPYIEQYYHQLHKRQQLLDCQHLKTMPSPSNSKKSHRSSRVGRIQRQKVNKESAENQYQNSSTARNNNNASRKSAKAIPKDSKKDFQQNQYDMIPLKNEKIKDKLSRKISKTHQIQVCKQLITEVKNYEEINHKYLKKLKSTDKTDKKSRDKLFEASSRDKIQKRKNIQNLKNRITSKSSRKEVRF